MPLEPIEEFIPCNNCGNDKPSKFSKRSFSDLGPNDPDPRFKFTQTPDADLPGEVWVCDDCGEMPNDPGDTSDLSYDDIMDA